MEILAVRIKVRRIQRAFRRVNSSGRRSDGESERRVEVKKREFIYSAVIPISNHIRQTPTQRKIMPLFFCLLLRLMIVQQPTFVHPERSNKFALIS